jgi:hypothetical protein
MEFCAGTVVRARARTAPYPSRQYNARAKCGEDMCLRNSLETSIAVVLVIIGLCLMFVASGPKRRSSVEPLQWIFPVRLPREGENCRSGSVVSHLSLP